MEKDRKQFMSVLENRKKMKRILALHVKLCMHLNHAMGMPWDSLDYTHNGEDRSILDMCEHKSRSFHFHFSALSQLTDSEKLLSIVFTRKPIS